ncbi:MAG: helix-turn-helix transcriptional regulator, partial [Polyangiaceae bacterium]
GSGWSCRCGEYLLTTQALDGYAKRAARTVLVDVPRVDGSVLKFARKALRLTQVELASLLDVASETVSRWENNRDPVVRSTQLAVAELLDLTLREGDDVLRALLASDSMPSGPLNVRVA